MSSVADIRNPQQNCAATAKKLVQAAALAAALVPLGSVAADAATIDFTCGANGGVCTSGEFGGGTGFYGSGTPTSYTWGFFGNSTLLYTLGISGTAATSFSLAVSDQQIAPNFEGIAFPVSSCIPLLADGSQCVIFNVIATPEADWVGEYEMVMTWFAPEGEPGSSAAKPLQDNRNYIFRRPDGADLFTDALTSGNFYNPSLTPEDPALGGRGSTFSSFIAGRANVPEPATVLLLGSGMAVALYRRRRR